jgi:hypothetical protein
MAIRNDVVSRDVNLGGDILDWPFVSGLRNLDVWQKLFHSVDPMAGVFELWACQRIGRRYYVKIGFAVQRAGQD